nr:MAG TPA: hypothetical protein [Caudoviricetes sp.]DAW21121.1 MAG TPA: hypothetical protein [Caudoviricetes sp.]
MEYKKDLRGRKPTCNQQSLRVNHEGLHTKFTCKPQVYTLSLR